MNKEKKQDLLYLLVNKKDFVTAKELSSQLHTSNKTIYRIIATINQEYGQQPLIVSERGRGYKLDYGRYLDGNTATNDLTNISNVSPVERRNRVMKRLLLIAPMRIRTVDLFKPYFVSASTQVADEKIITKILKQYNLALVKQRGYLQITGTELNIRDAIQSLINNLDIVDLSQVLQSDNFPRKFDARFVYDQIQYIETAIQSVIPYPYNLNLFSHMYILIDRVRNTRLPLKKANDDAIAAYLQDANIDERLLKLSEQVIKNTEDYTAAKLPYIERYYLYQYLVSSRINGFTVETIDETQKVQKITKAIIQLVEQDLNRSLFNQQLFNDLSEHIRPMLNRLDNNIKITNNLLGQIKIEYQSVFEAVKHATTTLRQQHELGSIDDNEVGFLTLYFASELEQKKQIIPTLIMCTTGIGTSTLLKTKVEKHFNNLQIVDVIATVSLDEALKQHPQVRLVISTVKPLREEAIPVVVVSAMLNVEDRKKINEEVEKIQ